MLDGVLADGETLLTYNPKLRELGLRVLDGGTSVIVLRHCPWCGQELPSSLRDEWHDRVEALGMEPIDPNLPPELRTAEWWHSEGL
tara:strand:- start:215 stop:472 length:258 start_codon:yes stop_codon:yes gene_type:complete